MDKLVASIKLNLANTFVMYYKTHAYHWNVEGVHFPQLHSFFEMIYSDVYEAIDPFAEELRKLDTYAPISLMELYNYKTITEDTVKPKTSREMLLNLLLANADILTGLTSLFDEATKQKQQGLANFVADRMDKHKKWEWQLHATIKMHGEE
jgi:starvation-inducible DNA-binding protein